jgi:WD40 repeat protein
VTSSFDGTIKTWNTRDWAPIGSYSGHEGKVTCVDVFHNEQQLVSVSFDRTVKIWEHEESSLLV